MSDKTKRLLARLYPEYLGAKVKEKHGLIFVFLDNRRHECHRWVETADGIAPAPKRSRLAR